MWALPCVARSPGWFKGIQLPETRVDFNSIGFSIKTDLFFDGFSLELPHDKLTELVILSMMKLATVDWPIDNYWTWTWPCRICHSASWRWPWWFSILQAVRSGLSRGALRCARRWAFCPTRWRPNGWKSAMKAMWFFDLFCGYNGIIYPLAI